MVILMFVGRKEELNILNNFINSNDKTFILYGKRRVGKTELIKETFRINKAPYIYFECTKDTLKNNVLSFIDVLVSNNVLPERMDLSSFIDVFRILDISNKKLNIVIDEYPYLYEFNNNLQIDSDFQKIMDNYLKNIKLIICGSNIAVMSSLLEEKNSLFGRFDKTLLLNELSYLEAQKFYNDKSYYEKIAFYSIYGGSPFLNKRINPKLSLEDNIKNTFLDINSDIFVYCNNLLFTDVPSSININSLCLILKNGKKTCSEIENAMRVDKNGGMNKKLDLLVKMNLISKYQPINKTGNPKSTRYEINDNSIRFFYGFIYQNLNILYILGPDRFYEEYIKDKIITFISHRFEEIVRNYYSIAIKKGMYKDVINIGTYYYDDSKNKTNGEFDVALMLKNNTYKIVEVKYYKDKVLTLKEMKEEYNQVKNIKEINVSDLIFVSTSEIEKTDEFEILNIKDIYFS